MRGPRSPRSWWIPRRSSSGWRSSSTQAHLTATSYSPQTWTSTAPFAGFQILSGVLDGGGHTISGITYAHTGDDDADLGLVRNLTGGTIGHLVVDGVVNADLHAQHNMGGVVPEAPGVHEKHGTPTSPEALALQATYADLGWDFDAVWRRDAELAHPVLLGVQTEFTLVPHTEYTEPVETPEIESVRFRGSAGWGVRVPGSRAARGPRHAWLRRQPHPRPRRSAPG